MGKFVEKIEGTKLYLGVIFVQFGYAGLAIITKFALNGGMSPHVFVTYRHVVATLVIAPFAILFERKVRPKMTLSILIKILALGFLEPVIDQNLYFTGMKLTSATFATAMGNILPAFAFLLAWACRLEKVNIKKVGSQAKVLGTIVTVGGAMVMTFIRGPMLNLPWTNQTHMNSTSSSSTAANHQQHPLEGSLMILFGCICWSGFITLQAITLKSYPADLSLTALICFVGAVGDSVVALILERGNPSVWSLHFDTRLLSVVYGGIICSGVTYYIQGVVMQTKGPVFVTAFSPLSMILVAILSSFILSEIMFLGRIIGAVVIITGLYLVLWGKSKDQTEVKAISEKIAPSQQKMASKDEVSTQEFVVLEVEKETRS